MNKKTKIALFLIGGGFLCTQIIQHKKLKNLKSDIIKIKTRINLIELFYIFKEKTNEFRMKGFWTKQKNKWK